MACRKLGVQVIDDFIGLWKPRGMHYETFFELVDKARIRCYGGISAKLSRHKA
jgi:hypothetical protein